MNPATSRELPDDGSDVLAVSSAADGDGGDARPGRTPEAVLSVTFREDPDEHVAGWQSADAPVHLGVVSAADEVRSGATTVDSSRDGGPATPTTPGAGTRSGDRKTRTQFVPASAGPAERTVVATVPPGDLAAVGVAVCEYVEQCRFDPGEDGGPALVAVVDSLGALVDRVGRESAFRFLHLLTAVVGESDGSTRVCVDRAAVDAETVAVFAPLFDAVVEVGGE